MEKIEFKDLKNDKGEIYKEKGPFKNGIKAVSPSILTQPLAGLVYGKEKPTQHIGMVMNAQLEKVVSFYLISRNGVESIKLIQGMPPKAYAKAHLLLKKLSKIFTKPIYHKLHSIYYTDYKDLFIACETDIDFNNAIGEIKMSDIPTEENKNKYFWALLNVQMKIQQLCSGKKISLFHINSLKPYKDPKEYNILDLLDLLIELYKSRDGLTQDEQMEKVKDFFKGGQMKLGM